MKVKNIIKPYLEMAQKYDYLNKGTKFQILSMIMHSGNLHKDVFSNSINPNTNRSILNKHCERKCYEKFKHDSYIIIFVTIAPCDHCYKYFIKDAENITAIYYLASKYQQNKRSINDARVRCIFDIIKDDDLKKSLRR